MSKTIMIVDDNTFMLSILRDIFTEEGHEVVGEVTTVHSAICMYQELNPDIVIMDITMPDINGIEGTKEIMALDDKANVIIISAMNQRQVVLKALQAGARDFIAKPFQKARLLEAVAGLAGK